MLQLTYSVLQNNVEIHATVLLFITFCFVSVSLLLLAEAAPVKSEYLVSWIFLKLLTGFDPNFVPQPYWAALWSRPSHHSTLTDPTLASQPPHPPSSLGWPLLFVAPLIYKGMYHTINRPLSWVTFCTCPRECFIILPWCIFFVGFFFQTHYRPWSWLSRVFLKGLLWKFPSRKDSVGIPFHGVMHNSSLCGGSQPCHCTDQKQIKETEETTMPPTPPPTIHTQELTTVCMNWLVIFLTT